MTNENELLIQVQTPERAFEAPLHFVVYDSELTLIAASYMQVESAVKAISASIIEKRAIRIGNTILHPISGQAYRRRERPIGIGDIYHGMVIPRSAVWVDIENDESDKTVVEPIIFAYDGNIRKAIGEFVTHKFSLPDCWQEHYYDLLNEEHVELLQVKHNPQFPLWQALQAVRLHINEKEMLKLVEDALTLTKQLTIPKTDITTQGVFQVGWNMKEFITQNAIPLAQKLSEVKPHFDPINEPLHWSIRLMGRTPFPVQAFKIQSIVNAIQNGEKNLIDNSDMGCGKSISACGAILVRHETLKERGRKKGTSVLLSAPAITLEKWKQKEILPTLPNHAKVELIQSTDDALKLLRKIRSGHKPHRNQIEFYLLGLDRAKLGHEPHFTGVWKPMIHDGKLGDYAWHCPGCHHPIEIELDKDVKIPAPFGSFVKRGTFPSTEEIREARRKGVISKQFLTGQKSVEHGMLTANGVPLGSVKKWETQGTPKKCNHMIQRTYVKPDGSTYIEERECGTAFWRPALKVRQESRNRPRYNISRILKKSKKWFDWFCQDEVQQTKSESSGRGDAFAQMCKTAKQGLFLTGTLTTGKSTSIKEIIWRSDPQALLNESFNHETGSIQWAKRYGVIREIFTVDETENRGVVTRKLRREHQVTEEAGIAPQLLPNHLYHKTCFTELGDLGLPLVELKEIPEIIPFDEEHRFQYRMFHDLLKEHCRKTGKWGRFIPSTINYGDRPDLGARVQFVDKDTGSEYFVSAPSIPGRHAKLRRLIEIVKQELSENRGCVIYTKYSDKYEVNEYLQKHLKEEGISAEILSSSTSTLERFEWLNRMAEKEQKVLICNFSLVEVGLDLCAWQTLIYFQLDYDINKVRQSSRRHWRIGQARQCRTYYLLYPDSQQQLQFESLMAKRGHAMLLEGRIDKSELASYSKDSNSTLTSDIAHCLSGADIVEKWKKLAEKDIDEKLEIVSEEDFAGVLKQRMKELAEYTLSRCLPMPDTYTTEKLVNSFREWMAGFSAENRELLRKQEATILDGIRHKRIPGFQWDGESVWFDEVETFGFSFVEESAIIDHLFIAMGIRQQAEQTQTIEKKSEVLRKAASSVSGQLSFDDLFDDLKVVEIKAGDKKSKDRRAPVDGQLALDLF
jgi:hypothetical protein